MQIAIYHKAYLDLIQIRHFSKLFVDFSCIMYFFVYLCIVDDLMLLDVL